MPESILHKYKSFSDNRQFNSYTILQKVKLRKDIEQYNTRQYGFEDLFFYIIVCGGDLKKFYKNLQNKEEVYNKWKNQNK